MSKHGGACLQHSTTEGNTRLVYLRSALGRSKSLSHKTQTKLKWERKGGEGERWQETQEIAHLKSIA